MPHTLNEMEDVEEEEMEGVAEKLPLGEYEVLTVEHGEGVLVRHRVVLRLALPLLVKLEVLHTLMDMEGEDEAEGEPLPEKLALAE